MKYSIAVCGGTFDHFHKGHREFLRYGLSISKKLLLGLATDKYIKKSKLNPRFNRGQNSKLIEDYNTRKENIVSFLKQERALDRVEVQPINDIYIPKVWEDLPIEAIIASKNTIEGAKKINIKRQEQKKYPLKIEVAPLVKSANNEYISSSRIRNGDISREGRPYINPLWLRRNLCITEKLREQLKRPFGTLFHKLDKESIEYSCAMVGGDNVYVYGGYRMQPLYKPICIATVGDVVTAAFNKLRIGQKIAVVDFYVARRKCFNSFKQLGFLGKEDIVLATNPAGTLTASLFKAALEIVKSKKHNKCVILKVKGEEDLSVLPLVLVLPLGSLVFYGQPSEGVVKVEVSEETKNNAYSIVSNFSVCTRGH